MPAPRLRLGTQDVAFSISATGRPWRDDHGVARGAVAVFRDVTREKATQTQLLVSDRMASVGMLAAGVAHEINNPLACVLANLELSEREFADRKAAGGVEDFDELREMLDDARGAADRVRLIVRDLKIFSRNVPDVTTAARRPDHTPRSVPLTVPHLPVL